MSYPNGNDPEPLGRDDLRRAEARLDARLQEVNARLVLHDGRFAAMADRLHQADRRTDAFGTRLDSRLGAIDRRFDHVDTRLEITDARLASVREQLTEAMRDYQAALSRTTVLALAATLIVNGLMIAVTMWLVA